MLSLIVGSERVTATSARGRAIVNDETVVMSSAFNEMLIGSALASAERQSIAGGVIGGRAWSVDLGARQIAFENGPQLAADLLGTEASADQTWLWAWANPELTLSKDLLGPARQLTVLGAAAGARELTEGRLEFRDSLSIYLLGAVASELLHADAYFVAPSGPFVALLALHGPELRLAPLDGTALTQTLMAGLGQFELEHQPAIAAYLELRGARAEKSSETWAVELPTGEHVVLRFDAQRRFAGIERPDVRMTTGLLTISRAAGLARDAFRSYRILVDGGENGKIKRGATADLELPVGPHVVQLELDGLTSPPLPVLIREGKSVQLHCAPAGRASDARLDMANRPGEYISLQSVPGWSAGQR
jgi:uncharacterized protein DUF6882